MNAHLPNSLLWSWKNKHKQLKIEKVNSVNNEIATINCYHKPRIFLSYDEIRFKFKEEIQVDNIFLMFVQTAVFRKGLWEAI